MRSQKASSSSKQSKTQGKKRKASATSSRATKQARTSNNKAKDNVPADDDLRSRSSHRASVVTKEEDAAAHGEDVDIEIISPDGSIKSGREESEAEASDAELGK